MQRLVSDNGRASALITQYCSRPVGWQEAVWHQCHEVLCVVMRELSVRGTHGRTGGVCDELQRVRAGLRQVLQCRGGLGEEEPVTDGSRGLLEMVA